MIPRYHIWTIGCQMNEADSRCLASQLEALGCTPAIHARDADLIVVNTCVVRQQAEDKIYTRLRHLSDIKRARPETIICLMGCLVGSRPSPGLPDRFPFVDVFLPPSDTAPLLHFLDQKGFRPRNPPPDRADRDLRDAIQDGELPLPSLQRGSVTAFLPAVLGCSHACTFCVIPYRRGAEHSRPRREILAEARALAAQGVKEVTVLGQIVDRYGLDLEEGTDLPGLLQDLARVDGLLRIRFLTSHPNWFSDKLLDTVAAMDKIMPHIELPFQAGNDEVLARMRRGYTVDDYRRLVGRIRSRIPEAAICTDIIVGFPGETEEQFLDTHRLMAELELDMARIAKYSERPQTLAARTMPDTVSEDEKERRRVLLEEQLAEILDRKHRDLLGRTVRVLAEERGRNGKWKGRTPQNVPIFFEDERPLSGQVVEVNVEWTGPFSLLGRSVEAAVGAPP